MLKSVVVFLFGLLISSSVMALPKVFFNHHIYYDTEHQPYVETELQLLSGSLKFLANENGNLQAKLEITQVFKQYDKIIIVDKYILNSPEMLDSIVDDFYDLKRFKLNVGDYDLELEIKDLNNKNIIKGTYQIKVNKQLINIIESSDFAFIQNLTKSSETNSFTKNGYQMIPYFSDNFPPDYDKIVYYLELYNTMNYFDSTAVFAAIFNIREHHSNQVLEEFFQYKKLKPATIIPIINILPIHNLQSGEFDIVMHIISNKNDTILEKVMPFKRRSLMKVQEVSPSSIDIDYSYFKSLPTDSLAYYTSSLFPISPQHEFNRMQKMIKNKDTILLKRYFYSFWNQTAPENPKRAWQDYKKQVQYTERIFSTQIRRGYDSDRGRIYLKYGAPNHVTDQPNGTSAYPYQIWQYYRIGERSNVRFIFYNPDLVTNDYPLLHSDLIGEIQNFNWQKEILKRNNNGNTLDRTINGNSGIYFND